MADGEPLAFDRWNNLFVVLPMAELEPEFIHPTKHQKLSRIAENMMSDTWIVRRRDVLRSSIRGLR
jgi:7,8-dihydro-6-hydroxymethylpterin-pyrophosphokinase